MTDTASTTSIDLILASTAIEYYLNNAQSSTDYEKFYNVQDQLLVGLNEVYFILSCFYDKFNVLKNVAESCSKGENTLENIMVDIVEEFDKDKNVCLTGVSRTQ